MKHTCKFFVERIEKTSYREETEEFKWMEEVYLKFKKDFKEVYEDTDYEIFGEVLAKRICELNDKKKEQGVFRILNETEEYMKTIHFFGTY